MKTSPSPIECQKTVNKRFQEILPQISNCANFAFRRLKSESREDAVQDVVVQCYFAFVRIVRQGKADRIFPTVLARFAIRRYRTGRRASGTVAKRDLTLQTLQSHNKPQGTECQVPRFVRWQEMLTEDRRTPIPDQVSFRVDFPEWLSRLSQDRRRCVELLAEGYQGQEVARRLQITNSRVSQVRKELRDDWARFHGEVADRKDQ